MPFEKRIGMYLQKGRSWYQRDVAGIKVFSIHHSASLPLQKTNDQILQELMDDHVNQGWPGLSYHFVITPDGNTYQINNYTDVTWVDSINWDCIGICLVGYFHEPYNQKPTNAQLISLKGLLDDLSTDHPEFPADQSGVYGHRERFATACPGDLFFPYVLEYRSKLGQVDWSKQGEGAGASGTASPAPAQPNSNQPQAQAQSQDNGTSVPQTPGAAATPVIDPPKYTEAQYQEIVRQRDEAKQLLQNETTKDVTMSQQLSGFNALGYTTVDDVQKVIDQKDQDNRGLLAQIVSLKKQLEANHAEDYTALDMGTKAIDQLKELQADWDSMCKALKPAKPDITHVLTKIDSLMHVSEVGAKILSTHNAIQADNAQAVESKAKDQLKAWIQQLAGYLTVFLFCAGYIIFFIVGGR